MSILRFPFLILFELFELFELRELYFWEMGEEGEEGVGEGEGEGEEGSPLMPSLIPPILLLSSNGFKAQR